MRSKYADSPRKAPTLYRCGADGMTTGNTPRQRHPRTAENRTLCRARALSKREAFVASGRGRRQAAEAGADLRSKYADSPRKAPTLYRCGADGMTTGNTPRQRHPRTAENRTLCRARALSKREAFVASGRGRRQAAEAGADLRSKYADSPRKAPTQNRCDVYRISAGHAPHQRIPPVPRRIELYAGRGRKENASVTQSGTCFPNGGPGGKSIPESALRLGRSFRMAPQAETATRNRAVEWDVVSG